MQELSYTLSQTLSYSYSTIGSSKSPIDSHTHPYTSRSRTNSYRYTQYEKRIDIFYKLLEIGIVYNVLLLF